MNVLSLFSSIWNNNNNEFLVSYIMFCETHSSFWYCGFVVLWIWVVYVKFWEIIVCKMLEWWTFFFMDFFFISTWKHDFFLKFHTNKTFENIFQGIFKYVIKSLEKKKLFPWKYFFSKKFYIEINFNLNNKLWCLNKSVLLFFSLFFCWITSQSFSFPTNAAWTI